MRRFISLRAVGWIALLLFATAGRPTPAPRLVVLIVVDQLRADLVERYAALFTGGFKRLRAEGLRFPSTMVDHAITVSHPGHVTIATGMFPSHHGIVDGAWSERRAGQWRMVDAILDSSERIVDFPNLVGASPRQLLVTALPDWFQGADPASRTVEIGLGQYSAILHAGQTRGDVYWYSSTAGQFVTSTYYQSAYPSWVRAFNQDELPRFTTDSVWNTIVPPGSRSLADRDTVPYENDGVHTYFPHRFVEETSPAARARPHALEGWLEGNTPFMDAATIAFAEAAVRSRQLGGRGHTDYLSIVLSETDEIGHTYGPRSQEQFDNVLRVDRVLGEFFTFLDHSVGPGQWTVAVTADHGVANIPEYEVAHGRPGRRLSAAEVEHFFDTIVPVAESGAGRVASAARAFDFVAWAVPAAALVDADSFHVLARHSWRADRVPRLPLFSVRRRISLAQFGVYAQLRPETTLDFDPALHGSPYAYDRSVPLFFLGPGVPAGCSSAHATTADVAPTLATLGHIKAPAQLDGHPLDMRTGACRDLEGLSWAEGL